MNEALLQYLWRFGLIKNIADLKTTTGETVTIIQPGRQNTHEGPDFLEAKIKIGNTIWAGNVELHLKTSDWYKHHHHHDDNYSNIILHVVYESDKENVSDFFPELSLKGHIDTAILSRYVRLMRNNQNIACASQLHKVPDVVWNSWLERLLAEKWEHKYNEWQILLKQDQNDWRNLLYYRLAANFGFHINSDAFLSLAQSLPLNILSRHRHQLLQTEALLFGQSGLLTTVENDDYAQALEKEYHFLRRKYRLEPLPGEIWKFMRLRPPNFPTIRIAQFAALIHQSESLFSKLMEIRSSKELIPLLQVKASAYWDNHYHFGSNATDTKVKQLGADAIQNILINTVAPMQYYFSYRHGEKSIHEKSVELLYSVKPEKNHIISEWRATGKIPQDAVQSQALLQLYHQYCIPKKCLHCAVGNYLIRNSDTQL